MVNNGFETEIKYWNFLLSLMSDYLESEDTEVRILPFLSMINDRNENLKGNKRIISLLQKLDPGRIIEDSNFYSKFLENKKKQITEIIQKELKAIDFDEVSLFGISAKYYQWIPGMILAEEIKKIAPEVKIVVGGFGSKDAAHEALKLCTHFDFGCWGEGEYQLLELSQQLKKENPDFGSVPRLIYRDSHELKPSSTSKSEYLDFDNYIFPDYSDYVNTLPAHLDTDKINFPINTIRSCHWGKCKFCDFNKGYKLRSRSPECIVREIEDLNQEYGTTQFSFVDSDTFGNLKHFEELLDLIIALRYRSEEDYMFWAEIIPNKFFDARLMEKMAIAGFKNIFIGYDGLSDGLLQKMSKSNSFSDNILFVKYSLKNGINPVVNVIKHIPGESEDDVQECLKNLHFLRFFYRDSVVDFSHIYVDLVLSSMTKYYAAMPASERENYDGDDLSYLMPDYFSDNENRFHLFRYKKNTPANAREWEKLTEIENYYKINRFRYIIQENKGVYYYSEYCNDVEIENIVFGNPWYGFVLKAVEQKVYSFSQLYPDIKTAFPQITEKHLKEILEDLKAAHLIYFDAAFSNIISVIELGK